MGIEWRGRIGPSLFVNSRFVYNLQKCGCWMEVEPRVAVSSWLLVGVQAYCGSGYSFIREVIGMVPDVLANTEGGVKAVLEIRIPYRDHASP